MSNPSQASDDAISISMGSPAISPEAVLANPDPTLTDNSAPDNKPVENNADMDVLVSEIRDVLNDKDLAPLALVGKDAIVFLAESDWTERPVQAVA